MKPTPIDWPRLSSALFYKDAGAMIDWLVNAFDLNVRIRVDGENGDIIHSELEYAEALIMVSSERAAEAQRFGIAGLSPLTVNANTQSIMIFVDDVDTHCKRARAAGAVIVSEPQIHDYGEEYWADRSYGALDPENHSWWFTMRVRDQPRK